MAVLWPNTCAGDSERPLQRYEGNRAVHHPLQLTRLTHSPLQPSRVSTYPHAPRSSPSLHATTSLWTGLHHVTAVMASRASRPHRVRRQRAGLLLVHRPCVSGGLPQPPLRQCLANPSPIQVCSLRTGVAAACLRGGSSSARVMMVQKCARRVLSSGGRPPVSASTGGWEVERRAMAGQDPVRARNRQTRPSRCGSSRAAARASASCSNARMRPELPDG